MKVAALIKALQECPNMSAEVSVIGGGVVASGAAAGDLFTSIPLHGLAAGDQVALRSAISGAGLTVGTAYFVRTTGLTTTVFGLSTTGAGGALLDVTTDYVGAKFDKLNPAVTMPAKSSMPPDAPGAAAPIPGILIIGS